MAKPLKVVARPTGRPVIPLDVSYEGDVLIRADGEVREAPELTFRPEDVERMKAGYICARCYEELDAPFPDECPVCEFPMREKQMQFFNERFQGDVWVGPRSSIEDELAAMNEIRERRERVRRALPAKPSIIVPRTW